MLTSNALDEESFPIRIDLDSSACLLVTSLRQPTAEISMTLCSRIEIRKSHAIVVVALNDMIIEDVYTKNPTEKYLVKPLLSKYKKSKAKSGSSDYSSNSGNASNTAIKPWTTSAFLNLNQYVEPSANKNRISINQVTSVDNQFYMKFDSFQSSVGSTTSSLSFVMLPLFITFNHECFQKIFEIFMYAPSVIQTSASDSHRSSRSHLLSTMASYAKEIAASNKGSDK